MMKKQVGEFEVSVYTDGYPNSIVITDDRGGSIRLTHHDIDDLLHAINSAKHACYLGLPDNYKAEVKY